MNPLIRLGNYDAIMTALCEVQADNDLAQNIYPAIAKRLADQEVVEDALYMVMSNAGLKTLRDSYVAALLKTAERN